MTVSWYLSSRGRRTTEDYEWKTLGGPPVSALRIIDDGFDGIPLNKLVDEEKPGLVLLTDGSGRTVLLVTGLMAAARPADFRGRAIRTLLLGVARPEDDLGPLVKVAARALRGTLEDDLPISYGSVATGGFTLDPAAWTAFLAGAEQPADTTSPENRPRLDPDTAEWRDRVADELLQRHAEGGITRSRNQVVLLRTRLPSRPVIYRLKIWRCLSDVAETSLSRDEPTVNPINGLVRDAAGSAVRALDGLRRHVFFTGSFVAVLAAAILIIVNAGQDPDPKPPDATPATPKPSPTTAFAWASPGTWAFTAPAVEPADPAPGTEFEATWLVVNTGTTEWRNHQLVMSAQTKPNSPAPCATEPSVAIPPLRPGAVHLVSVKGRAPKAAGEKCTSVWRLEDNEHRSLPTFASQPRLLMSITAAG
ncbi:hypothetical protein Acor_63390 [Acrocarpospora corrugata]|uniref:Nbr1 FW domain-containing protein n=1 Tax=Acrocarpospora corrugata TaxID=35763 RepID=A0A5M3WB44_9ACTN|nr:NBR1-Ig-like domain-containing protein [Acrocarpospora corrugata]GES04271.1 hypothetical protein Acor_63390 [Acrocarpospora corrugata]